MRKKIYSLLLCFLLFGIGSLFSGVEYRFDFGPDDSPVSSNFIKVSEKDIYTPEKGYGLVKVSGVNVYSRNENFSTSGKFLNLDPLLCDHITGGQNFYYPDKSYIFKVDLPKGEYICYFVLGKLTETRGNTLNRPSFWFRSYSVKVNGKEAVKVEKDYKSHLKELYSATEGDYLPGDSIFEKYVCPYFKEYTIAFTCEDSFLLELSSVCPINFLIIYPKGQEQELKDEISKIMQESKTYIDSRYKVENTEEESISNDIIDKNKDKGFILFTRPNEEIYPTTRPKEEEINKAGTEFIPQGEKGVIKFSIYPIKDLKGVEINITDLTSKEGHKISKDNFSLYISHYALMKKADFYQIKPWYSLRYKERDFEASITRSFSLYIKVPENTPGGDYYGKVEIKSKDGESNSLPIIVKVLPFKLKQPDMLFGMYSVYPKSTVFRFVGSEVDPSIIRKECNELLEKMFIEMKEVGFNTVSIELPWGPFKVTDKGEIITDENTWELWKDVISIYQKILGNAPLSNFGMGWSSLVSPSTCPGFITRPEQWEKNGYTFSEKGIENAEKLITYFYQKARENNWPEIIFYMSDELSNRGMLGGKFGKELASIYRKIGDKVGFRICASMNGEPEHLMLPYLDIAIPNVEFPITEESLKEIRDNGCELWFYNIGSNRFTYGYYLTKARPKGRLQWAYGASWDYFNQAPSLPSLGHLAFSLILDSDLNLGIRYDVEEEREGIIDYRYYITLEELIKENKNSTNPKMIQAIKKGEGLLSYIRDNIEVDIRHYGVVGPWEPEACERLRWMIAESIVEVENAKKK